MITLSSIITKVLTVKAKTWVLVVIGISTLALLATNYKLKTMYTLFLNLGKTLRFFYVTSLSVYSATLGKLMTKGYTSPHGQNFDHFPLQTDMMNPADVMIAHNLIQIDGASAIIIEGGSQLLSSAFLWAPLDFILRIPALAANMCLGLFNFLVTIGLTTPLGPFLISFALLVSLTTFYNFPAVVQILVHGARSSTFFGYIVFVCYKFTQLHGQIYRNWASRSVEAFLEWVSVIFPGFYGWCAFDDINFPEINPEYLNNLTGQQLVDTFCLGLYLEQVLFHDINFPAPENLNHLTDQQLVDAFCLGLYLEQVLLDDAGNFNNLTDQQLVNAFSLYLEEFY